MINRGPLSSGSCGAVGLAAPRALALRLVGRLPLAGILGSLSGFSAGGLSAVLPFAAVSSGFAGSAGRVLRDAGRRVRLLLEVGLAAAALASDDSTGVGSGSGASATSVRGSSIRAPTDDTRLPPFPEATTAVSGWVASSCSASGPDVMGSNAPPKRSL